MAAETIKSSGGTYTTVAAWEAATDIDLSTIGNIAIGEIYDVNTTAALTITGATRDGTNPPDSTHYRELTVNSAYRHAGVWDTGKSYFEAASSSAGIINIVEDFCRLSYVQVHNTHATSAGAIRCSNASVLVEQVIGWQDTPGASVDNAGCRLGGTSTTVRNSIFYGNYAGVYDPHTSAASNVLKNCTIVGNTLNGIRSGDGAALTLVNVYVGGNSVDIREGGAAGWTTWTATTCMCEGNISETGLTPLIPYDTSNFTNVTAGSVDLHLVTGSDLIDVGTDVSGEFTIDINGATRSGTWDIGADEFVSAGGDPEGRLIGGKLLRGGLLRSGVLH